MSKQSVCSSCGTVGNTKKVTKGSFFIEIILWIFFIIPGLIYTIWRLTSRYNSCAVCNSTNLVPVDSPVGQKLINQNKVGAA